MMVIFQGYLSLPEGPGTMAPSLAHRNLGSSHSASCLRSSSALSLALIPMGTRWVSFKLSILRGIHFRFSSHHPLLKKTVLWCFGVTKRPGYTWLVVTETSVWQLSYSNCGLGNQFLAELPIRTRGCVGHPNVHGELDAQDLEHLCETTTWQFQPIAKYTENASKYRSTDSILRS